MANISLIFPGQGSQSIGMGADLAENFPVARDVFAEVDDALDFKLFDLMTKGEGDELTLTHNAQPAILAVSTAALRVVEQEAGVSVAHAVKCVAGHSLGEYSALVAASCLPLRDAVQLVRARGEAMQRAVAPGRGKMAALISIAIQDVEQVCREISDARSGRVVEIANDNCVGQVVISGDSDAVLAAMEAAKVRGAKRAIELDVSAPFHSSLMQPAALDMHDALYAIDFAAGNAPVIANVTADVIDTNQSIAELLETQLVATVRWRESIERAVELGVEAFLELGNGNVLAGLNRRICRKVPSSSVGDSTTLKAFMETSAFVE